MEEQEVKPEEKNYENIFEERKKSSQIINLEGID